MPTTLSLPHESRDWTEGDPRSLCLQLPRSGFWVRLYSPAEQRESLGCQDIKRCSAAGFLKQGNENLPLPELASPMLLAHSDDGVGEKFRHTGPLALCQRRPEPTLCSEFVCGCMSDRVTPWSMCRLFLCMLPCWHTIVQHVCLFKWRICLHVRTGCVRSRCGLSLYCFHPHDSVEQNSTSGFNLLHKRLVWEHRMVVTCLFCR